MCDYKAWILHQTPYFLLCMPLFRLTYLLYVLYLPLHIRIIILFHAWIPCYAKVLISIEEPLNLLIPLLFLRLPLMCLHVICEKHLDLIPAQLLHQPLLLFLNQIRARFY